MRMTIDRLLWMLPVLLTALVVFTDARPAQAQALGPTCFQDLRTCYGIAATRDAWWEMWASGLDCELTFADCARRSLVGH